MLKGIIQHSGGGGGGVTSLNALSGDITLTSTGSSITITPSGSTINLEASGSAPTFDLIGTGINTSATMQVGTGSSLSATGTGQIIATSVPALNITGFTLASNVTGSSLTSVGTITSGTWSGSFGAVSGANLTNLTAANISAGTAGINISGNAATATKLATGRTIAMTGDVTWNSGTFDGSANVTAAGTIANSAVTLAKIANAAASSKLLGSGASGSGSPYVEISLGTNLSMSGTTLNATGGGGTTFDAIGGGTNTTAAMEVGSGATLAATGTGTISATEVPASGITGSVAVAEGGTGGTTKATGRAGLGVADIQHTFVFGDGVNAIVAGSGYDVWVRAGAAFTITGVEVTADASSSAVLDLWVATYSGFPATVANSIVASDPPTLSSAQKSQDTTLTGWTLNVAHGSYIFCHINSSSTAKRLEVMLYGTNNE